VLKFKSRKYGPLPPTYVTDTIVINHHLRDGHHNDRRSFTWQAA